MGWVFTFLDVCGRSRGLITRSHSCSFYNINSWYVVLVLATILYSVIVGQGVHGVEFVLALYEEGGLLENCWTQHPH